MEKKNNLLTAVLIAGGLFLGLKMLNANNDTGGYGGGGGGDDTTPKGSTPATPEGNIDYNAYLNSQKYIFTTPGQQAAINAGTLNIFGASQNLNPPGANDTPFMKQYNAAVEQSVALTGSANIASAQNVLYSQLTNLGAISGSIQNAARTANANTQAAINSGALNIFGATQSLTPPTAKFSVTTPKPAATTTTTNTRTLRGQYVNGKWVTF